MSRAEAVQQAPADLADVPMAIVRTKTFEKAQAMAALAVRDRSIAGFFGDAGTGKTFALRYFCQHTPVETVFVTAAPRPQRKEIFEELLLETTGNVPKVATRELRRMCEEVFSEQPRAVVIDESQNLSSLWHEQLRALHDHPGASFALLLVGGVGAARTLKKDPQLWSRVAMTVIFEELEGDELHQVLSALHPVLANTDRALLDDIDHRDCRGNLRNWATFVQLALPLLQNARVHDRFSEKVVRAVFSLRGVR